MNDGLPSREVGRSVLKSEAAAILGVADRLDETFDAAVEALATTRGRTILIGLGKSGLVCRKIAATLSSTGTPAFFVHPTEALHGDLGCVVPGDAAILLSYGGETEEVLKLIPLLRDVVSPIIALCGRLESTLARSAEIVLDVSVDAEACPHGLAPTASSTATLAMGDALAMAVMQRRGFSADDFGRIHPGGSLGTRFLKVSDLMHGGDDLPAVGPDDSIKAVIHEIAKKGLGICAVLLDGRLLGVITDGDIRRLLERVESPLGLEASTVMSRHPKTIAPDTLAARARPLFTPPDGRNITALMVVDEKGMALGVLKSHDLSRVRR